MVRLAALLGAIRVRQAEPASVLSSAVRSHVGLKRTVNEDRAFALPEQGLWAVADGMGGHQAGDRAAQTAIDALADAAAMSLLVTDATIARALTRANAAIRAESNGGTSGTTIVALLVESGWGSISWVGDSRAYRWRDGQLKQLTRDHSLVQTLVEQGAVRAEEAERHPHANVVTRALGAAEAVIVDRVESDVLEGDTFLLCSDGLSKALPAAEIARHLAQRRTAGATADALIAAALSRDGSDNITAVVVRAS